MEQLLSGLIVREQSGFYEVEVADGSTVTCRLRGRLKEEAQSSDIAAIGDRVKIQMAEDGTGSIEEVEERTSVISRAVRTEGNRGAGAAEREHVIIANIDQAIFVFAAAMPSPNFRMLDRLLVVGEKSGVAKIVIVANKIDLEDPSVTHSRFGIYEKIGYKVLYTSAVGEFGVDALREILENKISVFTGPSGVGKTSLLNRMQPGLGRSVREVSQTSKEGTHTTRDSALVKLEGGGYLADTPGMRNFAVWDIEPEELDAYFVEISPLIDQCRFGDCSHGSEPGCAVRAAVERGDISKSRYESYLQLREELEDAYAL